MDTLSIALMGGLALIVGAVIGTGQPHGTMRRSVGDGIFYSGAVACLGAGLWWLFG